MNVSASSGLSPLERPDARVLVLGSFPSVRSLERLEYYANPRNQFWRVVATLFEFDAALPYPARCVALQNGGIALWDVCRSVERKGSLDANITRLSVVPNDLASFLDCHPGIEAVFMNGQTSAALLDRQRCNHRLLLDRVVLPSTSSAHTIPLETKLTAWEQIRHRQAPSTGSQRLASG